ncbi:MAG: protoporphyrinogen oxidase [Acidimicrobiales bacterium]
MKPAGRAVVVGGGIAGLSAAFDLRRAGWAVSVHEATDRWGGKILTSAVGDRPVDSGPDTFLARAEAGLRLCTDLRLDGELTSPVSPVPAYVVGGGQLHPLPPGSMLGVPTDLDSLASSGLISPDGVAAASRDLELPATPIDGDISVGELCRARLGGEVTDRLIDPLLGGINASDIDRLSLRAGAPLLAAAVERSPSLIEGLRALRPTSGPTLGTAKDEPVFFGLPGGISRIIDALVDALTAPQAGSQDCGPPASLHLRSSLSSLADAGKIGEAGEADAVIVATPADTAASLLRPVNPDAADELATIDYASVAQVTVELPVAALERELDASGILFPRVDGTIITACTWFSTKWAHYKRQGTVLLRLTSGRFGDDRPATLTDDELATTLLDELRTVIPIHGEPTATRVHRWKRAFPQYTPGHGARVDRIDAAVAAGTPHVQLAGAAYRGIGIPACIDGGRQAAAAALAR